MHKIETKIGIINKSKGSAFFKCNTTSVICTVDINNRHEQMRSEEYDRLIIDVRYRNINKKSYDKHFTHIVRNIIQECVLNIDICKSLFVNLIIDSSSSNTLWCAINAVFLGLSECGIPLKGLYYASTGFTDKEDVFVYDSNDNLVWYHAFCDIEDLDTKNISDYYKYVKEIQDFTIRNNLVLKSIQ
ncbi:hypothetical protein P3W45_000409 [Vairimorpha bombi]|jgi:exosome complex component RRP46